MAYGNGALAVSRDILNQALTFNGKSYTVIGVMPEGFQYPSRVEMWVPVGPALRDSWQERGNHPGALRSRALKARGNARSGPGGHV